MKESFFRNLSLIIVASLLTVSFSCSTVKHLKTERVNETDISGPFTLFLYSEYEEMKVAILDIEGDQYTFEMSGSPYNYDVFKGIGAEAAIKSAVEFISSQRNHWTNIVAPDGSVIGYDFRAIYNRFQYGIPDILEVEYRIEDKKVIASIDFKHTIKKGIYRRILGGD
jgi:hypothetical protein